MLNATLNMYTFGGLGHDDFDRGFGAPHPSTQLPVMVYLSTDVLDQCVQSVGHFPTADEFIQTRMIEKASHSPPPASAPPLELDGGKKTRRKTNKKRIKYTKSNRCRTCKHTCS